MTLTRNCVQKIFNHFNGNLSNFNAARSYSTISSCDWSDGNNLNKADINGNYIKNDVKSLDLKKGIEAPQPVKPRRAKSVKAFARRFVDNKRIVLLGGSGGNGCMSFTSFFAKEFAGPDGGDGGNGAHIIVQACAGVSSLNSIKSQYKGADGENGWPQNCHGKSASHLYIQVPIDTIVRDVSSGEILAELGSENDYYIGARGGAGGRGNSFFGSNHNRTPKVREHGASGERVDVVLELRVMADVGLVGFPNAGKSSLLSAVSRARPRVAPYPFTTLQPHVGIVGFEDHWTMSVADVPGLIEGASVNRGLGSDFLRHIQRCNCLLYVLDLGVPEPWSQWTALRREVELFSPSLIQRPSVVVANKIDLGQSEERLCELRERLAGDIDHVIAISARQRLNLDDLLIKLRTVVEAAKR